MGVAAALAAHRAWDISGRIRRRRMGGAGTFGSVASGTAVDGRLRKLYKACRTAKQAPAQGKTLGDLVDNVTAEDVTDVAVRRKSI